jgi:Bacteroidetes VLRF1 release factor/Vms1-associating treble clef domain
MYSIGNETDKVTTVNNLNSNMQLLSIYSQQFWNNLSNAKHYWKIKEEQQQEKGNNVTSNNYAPIGVVFRNGMAVGHVLDQSNNPVTSQLTTTLIDNEGDENDDDDNMFENNYTSSCFTDEDRSSDSDSSHFESNGRVDDITRETENLTIGKNRNSTAPASDSTTISQMTTTTNILKQKFDKKSKYSEKEYELKIRKQWENLATITISFPLNDIDMPTALSQDHNHNNYNNHIKNMEMRMPRFNFSKLLLPKTTTTSVSNSDQCENLNRLISPSPRMVSQGSDLCNAAKRKCSILVILIRSGRFAAGVFAKPTQIIIDNTNTSDAIGDKQTKQKLMQKQNMRNRYQFTKDCCIAHKTSARYTVRKGQGKAQSTQDNQSRPKSIGSQLRREGEKQLQNDIAQTIVNWQQYVKESDLIFVSIPKVMQKYFYEATASSTNAVVNGLSNGTTRVDSLLSPLDSRIRRIPLDLGRPTYDAVCLFHSIITSVAIIASEPDVTNREPQNTAFTINDSTEIIETEAVVMPDFVPSQLEEKYQECDSFPPMSFLHQAVFEGNIEAIREIVSRLDNEDENANGDETLTRMEVNEQKNIRTGTLLMTPLHIAASSTSPIVTSPYSLEPNQQQMDPIVAAECVQLLLVNLQCDPCIVDIRNRVPYFLATHEKVREAFRMSRAILGEEYCLWDNHAKVGPALSIETMQLKKQKEAEKKRLKRQRQKELKQLEKVKVAQLVQQEQERNERIRLATDAQQIRDGIVPPKSVNVPGGGRVCDFCQIVCTGKKKTMMFKRLDFSYCSTDCVNRHKRELLAKAAMARLG